MNILLHTIALEPARWTPQRVSRPLSELLPTIAGAGFFKLEIFEPHLSLLPDELALLPLFESLHLIPMVLSSYLDISPNRTSDEAFAAAAAQLLARVDRFGFNKVRLFPGSDPATLVDDALLDRLAGRIRSLAHARPGVEFLVETHDHSLADDPARLVELVRRCDTANVGLLWQPTIFDPDLALAQWALQKPYVRHLHLQNRDREGRFCRLADGVVPWRTIIAETASAIDVSLEFVPTGICPPESFDLMTSVQEAVDEFGFVVDAEI